ncbi:MAG: A24 family peptidase [Firmicutes bacterium]|nr:A24 family peptidase [Bacillota bacterium]
MVSSLMALTWIVLFWQMPVEWWGGQAAIASNLRWIATLVMAATTVVVLVVLRSYDPWVAVGYLGLWLVIAMVDATERIIPNRLVTLSLAWSFATYPWTHFFVVTSVACGLGLGLLLLLVHILTRGGLGMGDVKYSVALGVALGWPEGLLALVAGIWAAGLYALVLVLARKAKRHDSIPLGPFLVLGGLLGLMGAIGH